MRRVIFKLGLVTEPDVLSINTIHAAADTGGRSARDHWMSLSANVKTLLSVGALALAVVGWRVQTRSDIAELKEARETAVHRADRQSDQLNDTRNSVMPRETVEAAWNRQNAWNLQFAATQTQLALAICTAKEGK